MATPTSSNKAPTRRRNRAAGASLLVGLLALAAIPGAIAITEWRNDLRLLQAGVAVPVAGVLAIAAIWLARRARGRLQRTLGRSGGEGTARAGRILGWLALYVALIGAISLGVYAVEYYLIS
ncbi:MAG: hypothetical protein E6G45_05560 [Actinobacteria bacterium]|nr:MAG: hypothetical protein E6G45_05560 [Actinomycetota bacterium]